LLYASFRPRLAAIALAFSLALHLHQVGQGTFTPKLLSMPSTRLNRYAVSGSTKSDCCRDAGLRFCLPL